ncbi:hypothetical protein GLOTRDRAFT_34445 [Gloeophyllum trabeum ATCC 11539]|uniref:Uncharacterized protein n=1 Tax=Gloeophyllum trabeum (strain ATCC 11539 / FP-39264 / Madison 617) TaxID=670483 RepID=S7QI42_GLOTA|nr:uncharacterized protein GLOTRDRAFT_34445 [Gloeophyllum trabeum ATCC 11539]EPQ58862.1 hypothetical protein GLOTRDRAFT_34445 [Gloeophyllum trabeum ATCC 11539]
MDAIIDDRVYVGNLAAAQSLADHPELGITHVLSVCPEHPAQGPNHLSIPVQDSEYEDLLIHLPEACRFIQAALDAGGKVLVHCVMGISRSVTVVCAFRRSQIHPNYGFIKQLKAFEDSGYHPSPTSGPYVSWKRRQAQDVTSYLNAVHDTISIIPDKLYISSEFPDDATQAQSLLMDMGMTHVLTTYPGEIPPRLIPSNVQHHHLDVSEARPESLLLSLPNACSFIRDAIAAGGQVLVYSSAEWKAAVIICAYRTYLRYQTARLKPESDVNLLPSVMSSRRISPSQATSLLENGASFSATRVVQTDNLQCYHPPALPLFNRTRNFTKQLELFAACLYRPTSDHPAVRAYLGEIGGHRHSGSNSSLSKDSSAAKAGAAAINALANEILGSRFDAAGFNERMARVQQGREAIISHG